jgi:nucleotide-binding universal stress UspA family protein
MFSKILVPTDGSELSAKAIEAAAAFAASNGATLVGLAVCPPFPFPAYSEASLVFDVASYQQEAQALAAKHLQVIADAAAKHGVSYAGFVVEGESPFEQISRCAEENKCDLIFMASHGRKGLRGLFVGSQTQRVLAISTIPVLVFR